MLVSCMRPSRMIFTWNVVFTALCSESQSYKQSTTRRRKVTLNYLSLTRKGMNWIPLFWERTSNCEPSSILPASSGDIVLPYSTPYKHRPAHTNLADYTGTITLHINDKNDIKDYSFFHRRVYFRVY